MVYYDRFRQQHSTDRNSRTAFLKHIIAHFEDLHDFLRTDQILYIRIRNVFSNELWCKTFYQKAVPTQFSARIAALLKIAESYNDNQVFTFTNIVQADRSYPVQTDTSSGPHCSNYLIPQMIASFFLKTHPPLRYFRPFRYRNGNHRYFHPHQYAHSRSLPSALRYNGKRLHWGYHQEGHILPSCSEKEKYMHGLPSSHHDLYGAVMYWKSYTNSVTY